MWDYVGLFLCVAFCVWRLAFYAETCDPYGLPYITFSGDAPASEFQKIRESIIKAVPEFSGRFIESIEPRWAGAVGAARLAREYRLNPEAFQIEECYHDEL